MEEQERHHMGGRSREGTVGRGRSSHEHHPRDPQRPRNRLAIIKLFTGAPSNASLQKSLPGRALTGFLPPFQRMYGMMPRIGTTPEEMEREREQGAEGEGGRKAWRAISPVKRKAPHQKKDVGPLLPPPQAPQVSIIPATEEQSSDVKRHEEEDEKWRRSFNETVGLMKKSLSVSFASTSIDPIIYDNNDNDNEDYDDDDGDATENDNDDHDTAEDEAARQLQFDQTTHSERSFQNNDEDFLRHSFTFYQTALPPSSPPASASAESSQAAQQLNSQQPQSQSQYIPPSGQSQPRFPNLLPEDSLNMNTTTTRLTSFNTTTTTTTDVSFLDDNESDISNDLIPHPQLPPLPPLSSLTDLEDLPSPHHLQDLQARNINNPHYHYRPKPISTIVGVISISEPIPCRSHRFMPANTTTTTTTTNQAELVKLVVGDETASGVGVTVWLDSSSANYAGNGGLSLRETLVGEGGVRPMDVVLLRNVGLTVYMGKVYLNSMRNGRTSVEVVYRCRADDYDAGRRRRMRELGWEVGGGGGAAGMVVDQQVEKVRRVVEWVRGFVGGAKWGFGGAGEETMLPEDTQEEEEEEVAGKRRAKRSRSRAG